MAAIILKRTFVFFVLWALCWAGPGLGAETRKVTLGILQTGSQDLVHTVMEPDVLLMDEPFSSLDEITARKMRTELIRIWQETKKTVIFVTHDISEAVYLSNRLLVVTERPTRVYDTVMIDVGYPRDYDGDRLFEMRKKVSKLFLRMEECHGK